MAWPVLVFDIETIPDLAGLRMLRDDPADWTDVQVHEAWVRERAEKGQSDFMPLHLQRVLCISAVFRNADGLRVHSFVDRDNASEGRVVQQFFSTVERHVPQLVSWNGGGFDLPVLHYRGLKHGVVADKYWDLGEDDRDFKWNSYLGRYHHRHLDLMDVLAMYQPRNNAPLDAVARIAGFPGKIGVGGADVWNAHLAGRSDEIRDYCEADCANTYLLYLRFQLLRGVFDDKTYRHECGMLRAWMEKQPAPHWREFLSLWNEAVA